uniref:Uncharacterized protein n=1 Tax=Meloidogyne enterolobii TaxID=390850 RepID=A0A6V7TNW5_MELEN|nr:unnamed protein product [Meloidogyne enterolobii]
MNKSSKYSNRDFSSLLDFYFCCSRFLVLRTFLGGFSVLVLDLGPGQLYYF